MKEQHGPNDQPKGGGSSSLRVRIPSQLGALRLVLVLDPVGFDD